MFLAFAEPQPYVRAAGAGRGVVCIHANASSSGQWRDLMEVLSPQYRVLAADSYGAGRSPQWPGHWPIRLRDEVALLEPVFAEAGDELALVGHSYGGAVALMAALAYRPRVRAVAVYEPVLFSLIDADGPSPNEADGLRLAVADAATSVDAGDLDGAARRFIDYWMGRGSWDRSPDHRKAAILEQIVSVRRWGAALFSETTPLDAFRALDIPVLYMVGKQTTPSAMGVARRLTEALPNVEVVEFEPLGHMGPVTHPSVVNTVIQRFLEARWR